MPKKLLQDARGIKVYAVDGKEIRDGGAVAFAGGDNWVHNPEMPAQEIWIEATGDLKGILLHEIVEAKLMEHGLEYDEAHVIANVSEGFYRKTEDLDTVLEVLKGATGLKAEAIEIIAGVVDPKRVKKAAFDDMPWVTAGREVPDGAPQDDPYTTYLREALTSAPRRQRLFDVAGGTRTPGIPGALGAHGRALTVRQELLGAGINPVGGGTSKGFSEAFRGHLGDPQNVQGLFGAEMTPTEALATLGPLGVLTASREASDPAAWARAFGTAARTPEEQQRIRRRLHAAMTLHATKQSLRNLWDTSRLGEVLGKTPFNAVARYPRAHKAWEVGPEGWQAKPMETSQIPVLDPKYFPDNEEAARVAAKYGSFDKYARDLTGDWPTAKDPHDKEDHLYHTVKKDGVIAGMVKVKPHIDGFMISNLWVRPGSRGTGVGTGLMKRVLKHYGDSKLYLKAEIFDNSPLTQDELEAWYKKFGFTGSHEGKMTRPATKIACEVPAWAKKNRKLLKALTAKLKKTAGPRETAMTHADASLTALLEIMGRQEEPKAKVKPPSRSKRVHEILRKHAAVKLAGPLGRLTAWGLRAAKNIRPVTVTPGTTLPPGTTAPQISNNWLSAQRGLAQAQRAPTAPALRMTNGSFAPPAAPMTPSVRQELAVSNRALQEISDRAAARPVPQGVQEYWRNVMNPPVVRLPTARALGIHGLRLQNQARRTQGLAQSRGAQRLAVGSGAAGALAVGGALAAGAPQGSPGSPGAPGAPATPWAGPNTPGTPWWAGTSGRAPGAANFT